MASFLSKNSKVCKTVAQLKNQDSRPQKVKFT